MNRQEYDVIVVGAGSAGIPLASRLAAAGRTVLLCEAGPHYANLEELPDDLRYGGATGTVLRTNRFHNWKYRARASSGRADMPVPRGRVTGGTSAINGQVFLRGTRADFAQWRDLGNPSWGYEDVLPFFRLIEHDLDFGEAREHGDEGPIPVRRYADAEMMPTQAAFREAAIAHGFAYCADHNGTTGTGVGAFPLNNPGEIRVSTALAYLPAAVRLATLTLLPNASVRRVLLHEREAVGIEATVNGEPRSIYGGEVVLAAGAIGSPHLLMLSGVGPADELAAVGVPVVHELSGVGRHLQDHPASTLVWELTETAHQPQPSPMLQELLRYTSESGETANDMWISPLTMGMNLAVVTGVHKSCSLGTIALASSDASEHPRLEYRLLSDARDLIRMREAVRLTTSLIESTPYQGMLLRRSSEWPSDLSDTALEKWLLRTVTTGHHVCSTCRMGPSTVSGAVVDHAGRVHGLRRLRVADASIMPEIVSANTNATTIMIGEKIASAMLTTTPLTPGV